MDERDLVLETFDGGRFEITEPAARRSKEISKMLEDYPDNDNIPVGNNITKDVMAHVVEYLKHYVNGVEPEVIEKPLTGREFSQCFKTDKWAVDFINGKDLYTIDSILRAATSLNIEELYFLCSAKFASLIKTLNVTEVVELFGLPIDFTKDEEDQIMVENQGIMNALNF